VPKNQLGWLNLLHSPILRLPVTAKQRLIKFQEVSLRKGKMAMKGKTLRKGRF